MYDPPSTPTPTSSPLPPSRSPRTPPPETPPETPTGPPLTVWERCLAQGLPLDPSLLPGPLLGSYGVFATAWPHPRLPLGSAALSPPTLADSLGRPPLGTPLLVYPSPAWQGGAESTQDAQTARDESARDDPSGASSSASFPGLGSDSTDIVARRTTAAASGGSAVESGGSAAEMEPTAVDSLELRICLDVRTGAPVTFSEGGAGPGFTSPSW